MLIVVKTAYRGIRDMNTPIQIMNMSIQIVNTPIHITDIDIWIMNIGYSYCKYPYSDYVYLSIQIMNMGISILRIYPYSDCEYPLFRL